MKKIIFLLFFSMSQLLGQRIYFMPIYYNKSEDTIYGLLYEGGPYGLILPSEFTNISNELKKVFGDRYTTLFKDENFIKRYVQKVEIRAGELYLVPVYNYVSAEKLRNFEWADKDTFIKSMRTVDWNKAFENQKFKTYVDHMKGVTIQTSEEQQIPSITPSQKQLREEVYYPADVKNEYKFFHDAYFNAPNALRRDIEIAKQAGTINDTIFSQGTYHTPLTYALYKRSDKSSPETIEILLRNGVDPNAPDSDGFTPLYYAIKIEHDPEIIRLLLDYGADRDVIIQGRSLLDLETREEIKRMLQSYVGGTKKPEAQPATQPSMMKPSIPAVPSYENVLEKKMRQLEDAFQHLEQELMR